MFGPPGAGHARINFGTSEDILTRAVQGMAASLSAGEDGGYADRR